MNDQIENEGWYSEDIATFGDRMAGAREATGLDRKGLAKRMGVKLKTIDHWEEDMSEPRANKLQMLAGILNVSLIWLLTGEGEGVAAPNENESVSADLQGTLVEIRALKAQMLGMAEHLGRLEKGLRRQMQSDEA